MRNFFFSWTDPDSNSVNLKKTAKMAVNFWKYCLVKNSFLYIKSFRCSWEFQNHLLRWEFPKNKNNDKKIMENDVSSQRHGTTPNFGNPLLGCNDAEIAVAFNDQKRIVCAPFPISDTCEGYNNPTNMLIAPVLQSKQNSARFCAPICDPKNPSNCRVRGSTCVQVTGDSEVEVHVCAFNNQQKNIKPV